MSVGGQTLGSKAKKTSIFSVRWNEVSGKRFDPFFNLPELRLLDDTLRQLTPHCLRDFIISMNGGATPLVSEKEKYYSDSENGVPFLRVMNITEEGLNLNDLVYINEDTHEGYLRRSQVSEGDLLITITGRIASACVVPNGFHGNINQHSVVVKTGAAEISEKIAAFLNSIPGQRIALRYATGGTRPALDYTALRNLPIVMDDRIVDRMQVAYDAKRKKEAQAQALLNGIDDYLLGELGITLPPEPPNTVHNRMFTSRWSEVSGKRWDALVISETFLNHVRQQSVNPVPLKGLVDYMITGFAAGKDDQTQADSGAIQIRPTNISSDRDLIFEKVIRVPHERIELSPRDELQKGEVLFNNTNSQDLVGKTTAFDIDGSYCASNHITRIMTAPSLNSDYLCALLNLYQRQKVFYKLCTNWNNQSGVGTDVLSKLPIPLVSSEEQNRIISSIKLKCQQAFRLRAKAIAEVEEAKREVETMILGGDDDHS